MQAGDEQLPAGVEALLAGLGPSQELSEQVLAERVGQIVQAATQVLGVEAAGLLLLDEAGAMRRVASTDARVQALETAQEVLRAGPALETMRTGQPVAVTDLAAAPQHAELWRLLESGDVRAVLSAPVRVDGDLVGNLNLVRSLPHAWTEHEVRAATTYADVLAALLGLAARTRAHEALTLAARRFDPPVAGEDPDEVNESTPGNSGGSAR